jgi:hypothetical protein
MPKPGPAAKELFLRLLPAAPGVTQRPMFGQLAGSVNGNMFLCLLAIASPSSSRSRTPRSCWR